MATAQKGLHDKHCQPCEQGAQPMTVAEARNRLGELDGWELKEGGDAIRREWDQEDFGSAMAFLGHVAEVAEREDHHPDLHLTNYRHVAIELSTHAIGGLSENDFILAAKIDDIASATKS